MIPLPLTPPSLPYVTKLLYTTLLNVYMAYPTGSKLLNTCNYIKYMYEIILGSFFLHAIFEIL